jgi:hypothetical protein
MTYCPEFVLSSVIFPANPAWVLDDGRAYDLPPYASGERSLARSATELDALRGPCRHELAHSPWTNGCSSVVRSFSAFA